MGHPILEVFFKQKTFLSIECEEIEPVSRNSVFDRMPSELFGWWRW
jgi:hypothetical protein